MCVKRCSRLFSIADVVSRLSDGPKLLIFTRNQRNQQVRIIPPARVDEMPAHVSRDVVCRESAFSVLIDFLSLNNDAQSLAGLEQS